MATVTCYCYGCGGTFSREVSGEVLDYYLDEPANLYDELCPACELAEEEAREAYWESCLDEYQEQCSL
jgi:hypothetical protein